MVQASAADFRQKAQLSLMQNDVRAALAWLNQAITADPTDAAAHNLMSGIYRRLRDWPHAVIHALIAAQIAPDNIAYKREFIGAAGAVPFVEYNDDAFRLLLDCLLHPDVDCAEAQGLWHSLLGLHPQFSRLYKQGKRQHEAPDLNDPATAAMLAHPYFTQGLRQMIVISKSFENFIASLRRALLEHKDNDNPDIAAIAAAVACYAFNGEYILEFTAQEESALAALRSEVQSGKAGALGILILAAYEPLYALPDAKALADACADAQVAALQVHAPLALETRKDSIPSLTDIGQGVSSAVRAQYEEFPYPRWQAKPAQGFSAAIRKMLPAAPDMLVAGCGTGQEAAQLALSWPQARITAVDLSRASLAYAAGKAGEFSISNLSFRHADILRLGAHDNRYDYITSMGVLHHMQDPLEGWRVLAGLLKTGGIMNIGLYSEAGRPDVVAAREAIAQAGLSSAAADMRHFRSKAREYLARSISDKLEARRDYYTLSMCRDLIFHVQEHRFTVPRIAQCLEALGLEFLGFDNVVTLKQPLDLDAWHAQEQAHPDTFKNMYKFWCRKKA